MKKNDIALIILIVSIVLVISFLLLKTIFGEPGAKSTQVEKVEPIAETLTQPTTEVFNKDAINPTIVIQIGNPSNQQPFSQ